MTISFFKSTQKYRFNPFGGISEEELTEVFVPSIEPEELIKIIEEKHPVIIEFVGKKGRGKTTHLISLQNLLPQTEVQFLERGNSFSDDEESKILLIDSIGHVPVFKRFKLYNRPDFSLIFTTHFSRKAECFLSKKRFVSLKIKGLSSEKLLNILENRMILACEETLKNSTFTLEIANFLIKKHKDDLRAILRFLYHKFEAEKSSET